ncbi:MAG: DUF2079 domain-containing protein [Planctomycetaceae bacterium]|nr:DUF2079 domain-containing protein [Planctomycetaceae bacterium]
MAKSGQVIRSRRQPIILPVILALVGVAGLAEMVRTALITPPLATAIVPTDVLQTLTALFGGSLRMYGSPVAEVHLSFLAIFWRVWAILAAPLTITTWGSSNRRADLSAGFLRLGQVSCLSFLWLLAAWWIPLAGGLQANMFLILTTPLFLGGLSALAINSIWPQSPKQPSAQAAASSRRPLVLLLAATVAWTGISFWLNERLYAGLWIPHGDSAMYEEHLWNIWHGKGFRSYLDQGLFLGEHIQVIHLLLLPLHLLWPSHLLLELAESIALASCTIPIYLIARRNSQSSTAAALLAAAWLFFYPMHYLDIAIDHKTLRPLCFGLPFLFFAIERAEQGAWKAATVCLILALSAKEDIALTTMLIGAVIALTAFPVRRISEQGRRRFRWGIATCAGSASYLLIVVLIVIPWFRDGAEVHYARYFGDLGSTPAELVRTSLSDPLHVASRFFEFRTLYYLCVFLIPCGALALRSPLRLMAGGLSFVMLSLMQLSSVAGASGFVAKEPPPVPFHHFHAPLLVIIFWAAASGLPEIGQAQSPLATTTFNNWNFLSLLKWIRQLPGTSTEPISLARGALLCAVLTGMMGSMSPCGLTFWSSQSSFGYQHLYVPGPRAAAIESVLQLIPDDARVASTDYVHTRLTHRERSYDYSDYLRAVNNYQPGVPPDTQYIVIDTSHPYSKIHNPSEVPELQQHPEDWELLPDQTGGLFIVLKRRL